MNRSSKSDTKLREPGELRAGAIVRTEWTWELPLESLCDIKRA
jgi:hypothetical protein